MEQRTIRPRIADVARYAGVSQDRRVVRLQQPRPPVARDRQPDPRRGRAARLHAAPGRSDAHPAPDADDRRPHAAGALGRLLQPVLRCLHRGRRGARPRSPATRSISSRRCAARWRTRSSRATVDGVVAIGLSDEHPEVEEIRRAGVPIVMVDSTALPDHPSIEIDDVGGARAAAEHLIGLGHRDVVVIGVEPPVPGPALDPEGVTARRLRGYREAFAAVGVDDRRRPRRPRPGEHRRRDRRAGSASGRPACVRRPCSP